MKARPRSGRASGDCRAQLEALLAYLDGELTPARRRTIARHLDACQCCGELTEELARAVALCRAHGEKVPRAVHARACAQARAVMAGTVSPAARNARRRTR